MSPQDKAEAAALRGQWLRDQRHSRGWSVMEMRRRLREAAKDTGDTLPGNECLGVMIRRWEKGTGGVSERYRMYFCRAFGIPLDKFGVRQAATAPPQAPDIQPRGGPPTPGHRDRPLNEGDRAELFRLRRENAELTVKCDALKSCLAILARDATGDIRCSRITGNG